MISAQEEWRKRGTGTWLKGVEEGFVRDKGLAHTQTRQKK